MCSRSGEHISSPVSQTNQQQETAPVRHTNTNNQLTRETTGPALVRYWSGNRDGRAGCAGQSRLHPPLPCPTLPHHIHHQHDGAGRQVPQPLLCHPLLQHALPRPRRAQRHLLHRFGLKVDIDTDRRWREAVRRAGRGGGRALRGRLRGLLHLLSPVRGADTGEQHLPHHRHLQQLLHLHRLPLQPPG